MTVKKRVKTRDKSRVAKKFEKLKRNKRGRNGKRKANKIGLGEAKFASN